MIVQRCRTLKAWNYFRDLFLCDPWFFCKVITLFGDLWGLWRLYGMSRRVMARAAHQPFLCIIPLGRKAFSWMIPSTEAENWSARCWRSLHSPLIDWVHSLSSPLSWNLKKPPAFFDVVGHWKWLDKIRGLFEIKLAKWVGEGLYKWVVIAFPIEACVFLQRRFLNQKHPKKKKNHKTTWALKQTHWNMGTRETNNIRRMQMWESLPHWTQIWTALESIWGLWDSWPWVWSYWDHWFGAYGISCMLGKLFDIKHCHEKSDWEGSRTVQLNKEKALTSWNNGLKYYYRMSHMRIMRSASQPAR